MSSAGGVESDGSIGLRVACFVVAGAGEDSCEVAWDVEVVGHVWGLPVAGLSTRISGLLDEMDAISGWVLEHTDADPAELAELWRMSLVLEERLRAAIIEDG